jgi:hypothetical protein
MDPCAQKWRPAHGSITDMQSSEQVWIYWIAVLIQSSPRNVIIDPHIIPKHLKQLNCDQQNAFFMLSTKQFECMHTCTILTSLYLISS